MVGIKCIEATPEGVRDMQVAMQNMDAFVQEADERIGAMAEAMKAMLIHAAPYSKYTGHLVALCDMIKDTSSSAMNEVNSRAEAHHANWKREEAHHA